MKRPGAEPLETQFVEALRKHQDDPDITSLLKDIVTAADDGEEKAEDETIVCFSDGSETYGILLPIVGPLIYPWATDALDHLRARQDIDLLK